MRSQLTVDATMVMNEPWRRSGSATGSGTFSSSCSGGAASVEAPGGTWVYTLYTHWRGAPFVHALDTVHARAERCRQARLHRAEDETARGRDSRMPVVESVTTDFQGDSVRGGERIHVTMRATPGGRGFFRIRGVVGEQKMDETSPGVYELRWRSPEDKEFRVRRADFLAFVVVGDRATAEKNP